MRKQLWAGWSVELDGTTGEERNPNGSWACWGADWAADVQIIEFQAPTSRGLVQRVLDEGGEPLSGKGWTGAAKFLQEFDQTANQTVIRFAGTLVASGTFMSCWVSFMSPERATVARAFVQAVEHAVPGWGRSNPEA